jgi:hypothetical protein
MIRRLLRWIGICPCGGLYRPAYYLGTGRVIMRRCERCGRLD